MSKSWTIQVTYHYFLPHNWQSKGCPRGPGPVQALSHTFSRLSLQQQSEVGAIISNLEVRKLRLGGVKQLALGHTTKKGWTHALDTPLSTVSSQVVGWLSPRSPRCTCRLSAPDATGILNEGGRGGATEGSGVSLGRLWHLF